MFLKVQNKECPENCFKEQVQKLKKQNNKRFLQRYEDWIVNKTWKDLIEFLFLLYPVAFIFFLVLKVLEDEVDVKLDDKFFLSLKNLSYYDEKIFY